MVLKSRFLFFTVALAIIIGATFGLGMNGKDVGERNWNLLDNPFVQLLVGNSSGNVVVGNDEASYETQKDVKTRNEEILRSTALPPNGYRLKLTHQLLDETNEHVRERREISKAPMIGSDGASSKPNTFIPKVGQGAPATVQSGIGSDVIIDRNVISSNVPAYVASNLITTTPTMNKKPTSMDRIKSARNIPKIRQNFNFTPVLIGSGSIVAKEGNDTIAFNEITTTKTTASTSKTIFNVPALNKIDQRQGSLNNSDSDDYDENEVPAENEYKQKKSSSSSAFPIIIIVIEIILIFAFNIVSIVICFKFRGKCGGIKPVKPLKGPAGAQQPKGGKPNFINNGNNASKQGVSKSTSQHPALAQKKQSMNKLAPSSSMMSLKSSQRKGAGFDPVLFGSSSSYPIKEETGMHTSEIDEPFSSPLDYLYAYGPNGSPPKKNLTPRVDGDFTTETLFPVDNDGFEDISI